MNNKDLFSLLEIILDSSLSKTERKEQAIEYSRRNKTDRSVAITVAGATNTKLDYSVLEKGDDGMCTLFKEIAEESRAEGIAEGIEKGRAEGKAEGRAEGKAEGRARGIIETGLDFGLSENDILARLQVKLEISFEMAQEYFKMFGKKTV